MRNGRFGGWILTVPVAGVAALLAVPASANEVVYEGCVDFRGQAVASVADGSVTDVAAATIDAPSGIPVIYYNPLVLGWLSDATRRFIYMHECGHHSLGHAISYDVPIYQEQEADCWAIRQLAASGGFSDADLRQVQSDIAQLAPGDWEHLPGDRRAVNLDACLQDGVSIAEMVEGRADGTTVATAPATVAADPGLPVPQAEWPAERVEWPAGQVEWPAGPVDPMAAMLEMLAAAMGNGNVAPWPDGSFDDVDVAWNDDAFVVQGTSDDLSSSFWIYGVVY